MIPRLKLLLLLLLLHQASAHVFQKIETTPKFDFFTGVDSSFTWIDGRIRLCPSFDIGAGKSSIVLAVAGDEEEIYHDRFAGNIKPSVRDLTLFIAYNPSGELDYDEQLKAVRKLQKHYTEDQGFSLERLDLNFNPKLEFAKIDILLSQADVLNAQQDAGIEIFEVDNVEGKNSNSPTDDLSTQQRNGIDVLTDAIDYVERNSPNSAEKTLKLNYGDQVKYSRYAEPLIVLWVGHEKVSLCSTRTGAYHQYYPKNLMTVPDNEKISMEKKVSNDGRYKYMIRNSEVYYCPEGREEYLRCIILAFSPGNPTILKCGTESFTNVNWEHMWPVEAFEYIRKFELSTSNNNNNNTRDGDDVAVGGKRGNQQASSDASESSKKRKLCSMNIPECLPFPTGAQLSHFGGDIPYLHMTRPNTIRPYVVNSHYWEKYK